MKRYMNAAEAIDAAERGAIGIGLRDLAALAMNDPIEVVPPIERSILEWMAEVEEINAGRVFIDVPECPEDADMCPVTAYVLTEKGELYEAEAKARREALMRAGLI